MGKGDNQRPAAIPPKVYDSNWSRTFGQIERFKEIAMALGDSVEGEEVSTCEGCVGAVPDHNCPRERE